MKIINFNENSSAEEEKPKKTKKNDTVVDKAYIKAKISKTFEKKFKEDQEYQQKFI